MEGFGILALGFCSLLLVRAWTVCCGTGPQGPLGLWSHRDKSDPLRTLRKFFHFEKFVLQKKEFDVDTLSKSELRMLLSVMEGELEARDLVIEALRVRIFQGQGPFLCHFLFSNGQWQSFFFLIFESL